MARAAATVLVTAEEIVLEEEIRRHPDRTAIPGFVVDAVVPMIFDRGPRPVDVPAGSATEEAAEILKDTGARVIGAFHNLSAEELLKPDVQLDADVLVTGGDIPLGKFSITRSGDSGVGRFTMSFSPLGWVTVTRFIATGLMSAIVFRSQ